MNNIDWNPGIVDDNTSYKVGQFFKFTDYANTQNFLVVLTQVWRKNTQLIVIDDNYARLFSGVQFDAEISLKDLIRHFGDKYHITPVSVNISVR